ncbi:MAG: hypothetical protein JRC92_02295, partial [Deltaproteobacteria bacterium]|nr:hypothetical protein [Deltaproteobacteria bacterium]
MRLRGGIDLLVVGAAVGLMASFLPWPLILSPATPTGGDTPSHFAALVYFKDHILPQGRLWGWSPGNLAGYPLFQFYFPLPFLAIIGLGPFLGLAAAFKLGVLLPALGLPASVYFCLRRQKLPFPGPAVGAVFAVSFLLAETNKVWGGNLPSILAGEFCYAYALNLSLLYLGLLPETIKEKRSLVWPAVLLGLIGLCHAYALFFCLGAGLFFLLFSASLKKAALRLFFVYALGFLLLAHWVIPMLVYSPYTEMFNFIWIIGSWKNFFPTTLLPVIILAGAGSLLGLIWGQEADRERSAYLIFWIIVAAALFLLSPLMNAVTIRFAPFGHLACVLLAAQGVYLLTRRLAGREIVALIVLIAGLGWAGARVDYLPHWLEWNNAGLEEQRAWPELSQVFDHLRGDFASPRVAYEHSPLNEKGGSVRVFESLPLLARRNTLEGLYLQASPNAPFVFYIQSEIGQHNSAPLPGYVYSRPNLNRGLEHLRLFNVSHYLAVEDETRQQADAQRGLILEGEMGGYSIYRLQPEAGGYAVTPENRPLLVVTDRPQEIAFHWFRFTDLSVPLAFTKKLRPEDQGRFHRVYIDSGAPPASEPIFRLIRADDLDRLDLDPRPIAEEIAPERIVLTGLEPGSPVLVKVSYHPDWRVEGAGRVYRVTPAFMLIWPGEEEAILTFAPAWPHHLGLVLTAIGLALIV